MNLKDGSSFQAAEQCSILFILQYILQEEELTFISPILLWLLVPPFPILSPSFTPPHMFFPPGISLSLSLSLFSLFSCQFQHLLAAFMAATSCLSSSLCLRCSYFWDSWYHPNYRTHVILPGGFMQRASKPNNVDTAEWDSDGWGYCMYEK